MNAWAKIVKPGVLSKRECLLGSWKHSQPKIDIEIVLLKFSLLLNAVDTDLLYTCSKGCSVAMHCARKQDEAHRDPREEAGRPQGGAFWRNITCDLVSNGWTHRANRFQAHRHLHARKLVMLSPRTIQSTVSSCVHLDSCHLKYTVSTATIEVDSSDECELCWIHSYQWWSTGFPLRWKA